MSLCPSAVSLCPKLLSAVSLCPKLLSAVSLCPSAVSLCPSVVSLCPSAVSLCPRLLSAVSLCPSAVSLCPKLLSAVSLCPSVVSLCPRLLHKAEGLQLLDLRGCTSFNPASLLSAPPLHLEQLYLAQSSVSRHGHALAPLLLMVGISLLWVALARDGGNLAFVGRSRSPCS